MGPNLRPSAVILLIDDEATPLSCRTLLLQSEGYCVLTASSAEEGLKVFRENHVDVVMSDHLLGSETGTEAAAEMKQIKPDVPVIIYSGVIEIPEGAECVDLFLSKTEPVVIMLQQISDLLKSRNAAASWNRPSMMSKPDYATLRPSLPSAKAQGIGSYLKSNRDS